MSHPKERQREFILQPPYCSSQALYWFLMPVPAGENRSALVTDTPRDHIFLATWLSLSPAKQYQRCTITVQRAPSFELSRQSHVPFLSLSAYTQPHPQIISRIWLSLSTSLFWATTLSWSLARITAIGSQMPTFFQPWKHHTLMGAYLSTLVVV